MARKEKMWTMRMCPKDFEYDVHEGILESVGGNRYDQYDYDGNKIRTVKVVLKKRGCPRE